MTRKQMKRIKHYHYWILSISKKIESRSIENEVKYLMIIFKQLGTLNQKQKAYLEALLSIKHRLNSPKEKRQMMVELSRMLDIDFGVIDTVHHVKSTVPEIPYWINENPDYLPLNQRDLKHLIQSKERRKISVLQCQECYDAIIKLCKNIYSFDKYKPLIKKMMFKDLPEYKCGNITLAEYHEFALFLWTELKKNSRNPKVRQDDKLFINKIVDLFLL